MNMPSNDIEFIETNDSDPEVYRIRGYKPNKNYL